MNPSDAAVLTDAQREEFGRQGFVALDRLTTAEEVEELQAVYDRLFEYGADIAEQDRLELVGEPGGEPLLPQILNPDRYAPELRDTEAYRNAGVVARCLLGPEAVPTGMHAIRKPAHHGAETPWHQDEAYWNPDHEHRAISIWMPLQAATTANGCMEFQPGSQLLPVLPHRRINPVAQGLVLADTAAVSGSVACPLPAGGATVHGSRTLHYAGPNTTTEPRRALVMSFACPSRPLAVPRRFPWQRPEKP
ncbi:MULTISPECIES: phytanoyl-CoA dioxygenase family protein [unclassified Streptomyces]|uniref:phytanoyl-CoA dioxygenase family protein n=1 Tax=unclassified Streptomyces TaxID=2593676 RepID=UPI002E82104B|nr:phytanoyl-CoA dioxygenase family protein [Streptomyces sp. NBC_00562]WTC84095.1 phytanoyl-CoA dioxygenase family protein [Streptomyces sp. NBC_01653]WTD86770.1 phytanoyl-CoA dioxygenase family protein [Streptomyces sp. NBC_01637]WUC17854.1 phytanoyl-CoA dioxygenase family protein [Streptomyces sp. NBC_00562]